MPKTVNSIVILIYITSYSVALFLAVVSSRWFRFHVTGFW